jgi:hypothetical protein
LAPAKKPHWEPSTLEHGHRDASNDPELVKRWFTKWPNALICSPVPAELTCIDFDVRKGATREASEAKVGTITPTLTVWSGNSDGGSHLFLLRGIAEPFSLPPPPTKLKKWGCQTATT